jgi:hypothetical protein
MRIFNGSDTIKNRYAAHVRATCRSPYTPNTHRPAWLAKTIRGDTFIPIVHIYSG